MFTQFFRAIVGAVKSIVAKKNPFIGDPPLPHGTPFSFNPASIDIHRANKKQFL